MKPADATRETADRPQPPAHKARIWAGSLLAFFAVAGLMSRTVEGPGITWDEPVYRYTQVKMAEWFRALFHARGWQDVRHLFSRESLHEHWIGGRYGKNFHPPMAAALGSLTHAVFGAWMGDMAARRMASALQLAAAAAMLFAFLARRHGVWAGAVAAGSLCLMPRVFGDANLAATDIPMMFFWAATAMAFWKSLERGAAWPVVFAAALGLGFLVKLTTVLVLLPCVAWAILFRWPWRSRLRTASLKSGQPTDATTRLDKPAVAPKGAVVRRFGWLVAMALPLAAVGGEVVRLGSAMWEVAAKWEPAERQAQPDLPRGANWYFMAETLLRHPEDYGVRPRIPGWLLFVPIGIWIVRLVLARRGARQTKRSLTLAASTANNSDSRLSKPAVFELVLAGLAITPAVVLAFNPGWWPDSMARLAHYYLLSTQREQALPEIEIFYVGQKYVYSLPWHNGWVLMAVTVPMGILLLGLVGCVRAAVCMRRDALPMFFLCNLLTLPLFRMLPTPAHDGVRLMLPAFFFLGGLAGLGFDWLTRRGGARKAWQSSRRNKISGVAGPLLRHPGLRPGLAVVVFAAAAFGLVRSHPYELSYYNLAARGLPGATRLGLEVSYWYDAVTPRVIEQLNQELPLNAVLVLPQQVDVLWQWKQFGRLRKDIQVEESAEQRRGPRFLLLLTHCSKSRVSDRLIYAMRPALVPASYRGIRLVSIYDEPAMVRAQALALLSGAASGPGPSARAGLPLAPAQVSPLVLRLAEQQPESLLKVARSLAAQPQHSALSTQDSVLLQEIVARPGSGAGEVLSEIQKFRPAALIEAVEILTRRPEDVARIVAYPGYLPPDALGGYLDDALQDNAKD